MSEEVCMRVGLRGEEVIEETGSPHVLAGNSCDHPAPSGLMMWPRHKQAIASVDVLLAGSMTVYGSTPRPSWCAASTPCALLFH